MKQIEVTIMGQSYILGCPEGGERALLEAVAVYGLVMGFVEGPGIAPLTLAMLLVPPVAYPFLVPGEAAWRQSLESPAAGVIRG